MEEVRAVAMTYYANMSIGQKQAVQNFYKSLDANGDGKVTSQEFLDALSKAGLNQTSLPSNLFQVLDENNDGTLDLEECVTFYYMITGQRLISCDGCGSYMLGLHFLCVECYRVSKEKTFDLCCSCYRNKNFNHAHSYFLDNFALLRTQLPAGNTWAGAGGSGQSQEFHYTGTIIGDRPYWPLHTSISESGYRPGNAWAGAGRSGQRQSHEFHYTGATIGDRPYWLLPNSIPESGYRPNKVADAFETGASVADAASSVINLGSNIASAAGSCTIM